MSTAQEIEKAIRSLSAAERDKLLHHIPDIFPEFGGDAEWESLIRDERKRPGLSELLDQNEAELARNPEAFPKMTTSDFGSPA
jgi:hypothetical protein